MLSDVRDTGVRAVRFVNKIAGNDFVAEHIGGKVLHIKSDVQRTTVYAARTEIDVRVPRVRYGNITADVRRISSVAQHIGASVGRFAANV